MTDATAQNPDDIKPKRLSRRERRAERTRAKALSPTRILVRLLLLPSLMLGVALSVYIRTSPHDPPEAMMHLIARAGCDAATYVGLAPAHRGELGYHARNDPNGDGVACERAARGQPATAPGPTPATTVLPGQTTGRMIGGAKFVKPAN